MTNYLILKAFNLNIVNIFFIDIAIAKIDLIKHIIKNNKIVKISNVIKEIMYISYYKCFSFFIISYKVKAIVYCFYPMCH